MLQRYADAERMLAELIESITRNRQYFSRTQQYDVIVKWTDKLTALLAIAVALSPSAGETAEPTASLLRDKYGDRINNIRRAGNSGPVGDLFRFACPRFISVIPNEDAHERQVALFIRQVEHARATPARSYLQLYSSVSIAKLAALTESKEADTRSDLMSTKAQALQVQHVAGRSAGYLDGELAPVRGDIHFHADATVVQAGVERSQTDYGAFFTAG
eukprot:CAMPEP_0182484696 /NCGR_PEP_ID=MMETSP1319-20130603/43889_1 /TAXON_ID=172717 /ORGANISM="Bolidomonas pacifica, Strain RCC208" /LENGTH=216 /DNA_ID=CAMNT_0024686611 /DNA_START=156 /DNA_END=802 /DNA_ORIENTATION=-